MLAHIELEAIGYNCKMLKIMPWVAEILGLWSSGKLRLKFIERNIRFEQSNSKMSRGVMFNFYPETGKCYAGLKNTSWKHSPRFYFRVADDGEIIEITEEEAHLWATKLDWEKTCCVPLSSE